MPAIQEDFPAPTRFLKSREQAKSELKVLTSSAAPVTQVRVVENQDKVQPERAPKVSESELRFAAFWETLSESEREQFEQEAVSKAEPFNQRFYVERKQEGGILFKTIRRTILLAELMRRTQLAE